MIMYATNGSNDIRSRDHYIDLRYTEQWRVSFGARAVSQSSTAGTLQDARNSYGTLPLSLTLMVRGGTKEKNRAIVSRILSRMNGKIVIEELDGYENLAFIGSLKSYSVNPQCERWYTLTLVFDCEKWITKSIQPGGYSPSASDVLPVELTTSFENPQYIHTIDAVVDMHAGTSQETTGTITVKEKKPYTDRETELKASGVITTPLSLYINALASAGFESLTLTATSYDTPDNEWSLKLSGLPAGHAFKLDAPLPGAGNQFSITVEDGSGNTVDASNILSEMTKWPTYAGGYMEIAVSALGDTEGTLSQGTIQFPVCALKAL